MITQDRVKEVLDYNPNTGLFTWRQRLAPRGPVGSVAGCKDKHRGNRVFIRIDGVLYLAHRLAWLYIFGWMPDTIDHINGDPSNNSIANLRVASQMQNVWNSNVRSDNTSGIKGVRFDASRGKWSARLKVNGKFVLLKRFDNKEEAVFAYESTSAKYHSEFKRAS